MASTISIEAFHEIEDAYQSQIKTLADERDDAKSWARHGYEIGQRSCTWSDQGVAPKWLTEGHNSEALAAMSHCDPMPHESNLDDAMAAERLELAYPPARRLRDRAAHERALDEDFAAARNDAMARHPAGGERTEPNEIRDAKHWRALVEARATIARVLTTVETWEEELTHGHAQVDEYARGYCRTMREALVGKP